jgi:ABC-type branched-subunit amino acid transport system substrate-binding protein
MLVVAQEEGAEMLRLRHPLCGAVVAAVVLSFGAGTASAQSARGNVDGKLVLGGLFPQTGSLSAIAPSLSTPVQIAVDEINAAGGVNGQQVRLVPADDGTDPNVASTSLDRLLQSDKVDAIVGPASSSTMLGILDKVKTAGVLVCSGSNTSAELSTKGATAKGFYTRTAPPDKLQGPALAQLVLRDGNSRVGILVRNDSYGVEFGRALKKALTSAGANVVADVAYDPNGANYDADVQKVANGKPDAIVVIGFNDDGAKVVNTMIGKGIGPRDLPVYTADGMQSSKFATTLDPSNPAKAEGIKGTAPAAAPSGVGSPFLAKFKATGVDPIFSSYQYDCTNLIALAAQAAKTDDPAKFKRFFTKSLTGKVDCNDFASCAQLLAKGKTIHYRGASSTFQRFGKFEPVSGAYEVWHYDAAGKIVTDPGQIKIGFKA